MQVLISFEDNTSLVVNMDDSATSREFIALLPLKLVFRDYVGKEKIASLNQKLINKEYNNYTPKVGDLFYYAPWGNIGIFYKKQPPNDGLIFLGAIQGSIEKLVNNKDLIVEITKK